MCRILGITGGVGAGKSTILSYLKERHQAKLIIADEIGRLLQCPGQDCHRRIVESFGGEILHEDGTIDREKLGKLVFGDSRKLEQLNALVHPAVKAHIQKEIALAVRDETPLLVIEAALLFEEHYDELCDELWYIHADEQVRMDRLKTFRGYTTKKAGQIMANQLSAEEFRRRCHTVIDNSDPDLQETFRQVDAAVRKRFSVAPASVL